MNEFISYEVNRMFESVKRLPELEKLHKDFVQELNEDIRGTFISYDEVRGVTMAAISVEDQVIERISAKENIERELKELREDQNLLHDAMSSLTDQEREIAMMTYNGYKISQLTNEYMKQLLDSAMAKICSYVDQVRTKKIEQKRKQRRDELKQQVQQFLMG